MSRNLDLFSFKAKFKAGNSRSKGHLKTHRPLEPKKPLHLILKSEKATGEHSFLRRAQGLRAFLYQKAKESHIEIKDYANAGNHLHLVLLFKRRKDFQKFFRVIAGVIPRRVLGAQKGRPSSERFWSGTAFTRVVNWGRDLKGILKYFKLNRLKIACGLSRFSARSLLENLEKGFSPCAVS